MAHKFPDSNATLLPGFFSLCRLVSESDLFDVTLVGDSYSTDVTLVSDIDSADITLVSDIDSIDVTLVNDSTILISS